MIAYLKREDARGPVRALEHFSDDCWVNAVAPDTPQLDELTSVLQVERDLLQDALDPSEVPRVQEDKGVVYVFLRVPFGEGDSIVTIPALVALGPHFLLTVCGQRLPLLERFFGGLVPFSTHRRSQLLLKLVEVVESSFQHAVMAYGKSLRSKIAHFGEIDDQDILKLVASEGVLNDFLAALMPMQAMMAHLVGGKVMKMYPEDHDLIEDVVLDMGQALEAAKGQLVTTVNFRQAYSVILTNNLNRIIKFLTLVTVVLTVPMVISGLYGMNVALPFDKNPAAFFIILGATCVVVVGLLQTLKSKRLL